MNTLVRLLIGAFVIGTGPLPASPPEAAVRINEWMANNLSFPDEEGDFGDWIELYNAGTTTVDLGGWFLTDNLANPIVWPFPAGQVIKAGEFIVVWADGKNLPNHASFKLSDSGEAIGLADPSGGLRDAIQFGPQSPNVSQGRSPDGAAAIVAMPRPTPGAPNASAAQSIVAAARIPLSPAGAFWRYFDRGQDLGTRWREPFYFDSDWPLGRAQLGFGDNDEATVINGGPDSQRHITTYFRRSFLVSSNTQFTNLSLRLLRDDGAAVYLNGIEIWRDNLPNGEILYSTLASQPVAGADETNLFTTSINTVALPPGQNVLAVEVHQADFNSSDLSFDLELLAGGDALPGVSNRPGFLSVPPGSCVELQAPAGAGPAAFQWLRNNQILLDATNRSFEVCNVQSADGGAYGLMMTGPNGLTTMLEPTIVVVAAPTVSPNADSFFGGMLLTGTNGAVLGNNAEAGREFGEPFHDGTAGGRSTWFAWTAPTSGIATFDTRGSCFDTLLAVYTGTSLSNLIALASDDERGGFGTASVQFNAVANVIYRIAVDGFESAGGYFTLRWSLESTAATLPTITTAPEPQAVPLGGAAAFSVGVAQPGVTYQWLRNGQPIPNATAGSLVIPKVDAGVLGDYSVRVGNNFGRQVESRFAPLILGECAFFYPRPFANLRPCRDPLGFMPASLGTSTNPVSAGVPGLIRLGETLYGQERYVGNSVTFTCDGHVFASPQYYDLEISDDGYLRLDTCGSDFPALLGLYHKAPVRLLEPTYRIACDWMSAALGRPASVTAQVTGGVYTVVVGRVTASSTENTLRLNQRLGPSCFLVSRGDLAVSLRVNTNRMAWADRPFTSFQWFKDTTPVASTSEPLLRVGDPTTGIQPSHVGSYTLIMTGPTRKVVQLVADVIITNASAVNFYRLRGGVVTAGGVQRMELEARSSRPMWLEAAAPVLTSPIAWTPLPDPVTNYHVFFSECGEPIRPHRFFRQRILIPEP